MPNTTDNTTDTPADQNSRKEVEFVITIIFLSATSLCAIFGNALVCAAFATNRRLRNLTNFYVVSLAISDILVGLFNIPLYMFFYRTQGSKPTALYEAFIIFDILCGAASIWNMTAISVDRLIAVKYPNRYRIYLKKPFLASFLIVFVWTFATLVAGLRLVFKEYPEFPYNIFVFLLSFAVPCCIIIVSYAIIYFVVNKRSKWTGSVLIEIKLARTLSIVIACFILCWGPFSGLNIIAKYCTKDISCQKDIMKATPYIKLIQYVSSCFNPVIYTIRNREFRFTFHKLIFRCGSRNGKYEFNKRQHRLTTFPMGCTMTTSPCDLDMSEAEADTHGRRVSENGEVSPTPYTWHGRKALNGRQTSAEKRTRTT